MATITRGPQDRLLLRIRDALDRYEETHPSAVATLYRQNSASVRVRVVDDGFAGLSQGERHTRVWRFLSSQLDSDDLEEVSVLLLLTQAEQNSSLMNFEFNDPIPSRL